MHHITNFQNLIGKTIQEIPNEWSSELILKFSDNSFCILQSKTDYDSNYHTSFNLKKNLDIHDRLELDLITAEEHTEMCRKESLEAAIRSLECIKRDFPELLK
jgi:hypothetical protein